MFISIITVSYNCKNDLKKTLNSILEQKYKKYELIIVDGNSKDGTKEEILKKLEGNNNIKIISENDNGVYDAMNKGIRLASGKYINFMNAGDCFYNCDVLEKVVSYLDEEIDVLYGKVENDYKTYKKITSPLKLKEIHKGGIFCHQSSFIKAKLLKLYEYNLEYEIIADYDFFYKLYLKKKRFKEIDEILSIYDRGGISSNPKNALKMAKEYKRCILKNNLTINAFIYCNKRYIKSYLKNILG